MMIAIGSGNITAAVIEAKASPVIELPWPWAMAFSIEALVNPSFFADDTSVASCRFELTSGSETGSHQRIKSTRRYTTCLRLLKSTRDHTILHMWWSLSKLVSYCRPFPGFFRLISVNTRDHLQNFRKGMKLTTSLHLSCLISDHWICPGWQRLADEKFWCT